MAKAAAVAGGALSAGFAYGVKVFADFDQQMSSVQAATGATSDEMESLRAAAIEAGRETFYSSTEAAEGIEELAKAGVSAADITGGALTGALNLAAAGGIDVAEAAETAASAMTVFGLSGQDVTHIADVLAAGAGKAQGSVHDMGQAFNQAALVSKQTGLSLEDTAGALAMFASNGLIGSDAGTSFKTMLMSLNPRSKEAAMLIQQLGISAYDQQGNFVGLAQYADLLQKGLSGLSVEQRNAALQTIFGTDAIRAASILYNEGAAGVQEWTSAVNDSGYAAEQGAARMDNLNGDIEQLKGSIESAILGAGSGANDVLRFLAQSATNVVNGFAALPGPLQQVAVGFAGIGGPAMAALAAATMFYTKISAFQAQMALGGTASQTFANVLGKMKWGVAAAIPVLGLAAVALELYGRKKEEAKKVTEEFTSALEADNGALGANTQKTIAKKLADDGAVQAAQKLGLTAEELTQAVLGNADAQAHVSAVTKEAMDAQTNADAVTAYSSQESQKNAAALNARADAGKLVADSVNTQTTALTDAQQHWADMNAALDGGTAKEQAHQQVVQATTDALNQQASAADSLKKSLDSLNATSLDVQQADIGFLNSLQALHDGMTTTQNGVDVFSASLDINTEAGRNNQSNMIASIKAAQDAAVAHTQVTNSVEAGIATYQQNIDTLFAQMEAQGASKEELDAFRAAVIDMPGLKQILVEAQTAAAESAINNAARDRTSTIFLQTVEIASAAGAPRPDMFLGPEMKAEGGRVRGPGSSTSDSIPAMLSDDEYVIKASAARRFGYERLDAINGGRQVMTPVQSFVNYQTGPVSSSSTTGQPDAMADEVRRLRRSVDQQTQVLASAMFASNDQLGSRLARVGGSSSVGE